VFLLRYGLKDASDRRLFRLWVPVTEFKSWQSRFSTLEELSDELAFVIRRRFRLSTPVQVFCFCGYVEVWIYLQRVPPEDLYCELVAVFTQLVNLC
jgi:hypothetical protein